MLEIAIHDAVSADTGERVSVGIHAGRIVEVGVSPKGQSASRVIDGHGWLISPCFVEPHYHLDKCFMTSGADPEASFESQVAAVGASKRLYTVETVADRAELAGRLMASRGIGAIRSFVDIDPYCNLVGFEGLKAAKSRLTPLVDVQIVAFPQHGLLNDEQTLPMIRAALKGGATVIGGHPQLEANGDASRRQIELVFELAKEYDVGVDFHVDENDRPDSLWLEAVVRATLRHNWHGRVAVSHAASLPKQPASYREELYRLMREARITMVSSPTSGLLFRGLKDVDPPRGITTVREMLAAGIPVACAQEAYQSVFAPNLRYPDPVLNAQVMAYSAKLSTDQGLKALWHMITDSAASAIGLSDYGLAAGNSANLLLVRAKDVAEVFTTGGLDRIAIHNGVVTAETRFTEMIHLPVAA